MLPQPHIKELAGPERPAQRCQVAHIVNIHKAVLCFPCIPEFHSSNNPVSVWPNHTLWLCRTGCPQKGFKAILREVHVEL